MTEVKIMGDNAQHEALVSEVRISGVIVWGNYGANVTVTADAVVLSKVVRRLQADAAYLQGIIDKGIPSTGGLTPPWEKAQL